jgi:hypothetical protein
MPQEPAADREPELTVAERVRHHLLVAPVVRVHLAEPLAEALSGTLDREPSVWVGRRVPRSIVGAAGLEDAVGIGEVAVEGLALHARARCDRAHGGPRRSDRPVQLDGRFDDPLARLPLLLGAFLQVVLTTHTGMVHSSVARFDGRGFRPYDRDTSVCL